MPCYHFVIIQSLILDALQSTDDQHKKKFILAKQMRTSYAKLNIQQVFLPILTTMLIIVKILYTNKQTNIKRSHRQAHAYQDFFRPLTLFTKICQWIFLCSVLWFYTLTLWLIFDHVLMLGFLFIYFLRSLNSRVEINF